MIEANNYYLNKKLQPMLIKSNKDSTNVFNFMCFDVKGNKKYSITNYGNQFITKASNNDIITDTKIKEFEAVSIMTQITHTFITDLFNTLVYSDLINDQQLISLKTTLHIKEEFIRSDGLILSRNQNHLVIKKISYKHFYHLTQKNENLRIAIKVA